MKRHFDHFWAVLSASVILIFSGCVDQTENPFDSKLKPAANEPDYHLVMDMYTPADEHHEDIYYIVTASTRGDSLVDSIAVPPGFHRLAFSNSGALVCFSGGFSRSSWLVEWPSLDTLGVLSRTLGNLAFSSDDGYLLIGIRLYTVPDLTPIYAQDSIHMNSFFLPGRSLFCYNIWPQDSIFFVDYGVDPPVRYSLPVKEPSGKPMAVAAFCPSRSGDSLILATQNGENGVYQRYIAVVSTDDLGVHDLVPYEGAFFQYSTPVLHPDGRKVYFHFKGDAWDTFKPVDGDWLNGTVYEYDLVARQLSILVDEGDVGRFHPMQLAVTPGGEYLYILDERDKIVRVRLSDNSITEALTGLAGNNMAMAVYPLAIEE